MKVPTVTLEDLQAFQAQHFPGHQSQIEPATQPVDYDEYYDEAGDDDDLGFYPDGVKRTLTDEQIRIFRHSEIHALLRARQLEQDDAEYEARRDRLGEQPVVEDNNHKDQKVTQARERNVSTTKRPKRAAVHVDGTMAELDYEEAHEPSSPKKVHRQNDNIYPGRKIVSYND